MENKMYMERLTICPYLKGSEVGAQCLVVNKLINDMPDVNIRICMSRRHEACSVYFCSMQMVDYGGTFNSAECSGI